jgi:transaldolase/glucose-6-phosphate isomerase
MIKVPATKEGIPAIEQLISEGINVNITLMFSMDHYEATAEAYIRGLERRAADGEDPTGIHSVASFFISRVSRKIDAAFDEMQPDVDFHGGDVAIANAKVVYRRFKEIFYGDRFADLRAQGALVQRPLWASTSTKNPDYSDVLYIEELIGPDTVNTVPPHTLDAFRDHGTVRGNTVEEGLDRAEQILSDLADLGIDLDAVTEELQEEGIEKFAQPFDELLATIDEKRQALAPESETIRFSLGPVQDAVDERLKRWDDADVAPRLWDHDPTIWADEDTPELTNRLDWLQLPATMENDAAEVMAFADAVKGDFDDVVVCGMGGSSLAPDVFSNVFGPAEGYPNLTILDSTHPNAVRALEADLDLSRTLFVISSKSGTTTETLSFFRFFWDAVSGTADTPGNHFVAVTDPGSHLAELGEERGFRRVFTANPNVGGRYSALTHFGLVPAALMGIDVSTLLARARPLAQETAFQRAGGSPSGIETGAVLGEMAHAGRDKVTFTTSSTLASFPAWLEQLIAESTGKEGEGIVPVAGEPLGPPKVYGTDRLFVHFHLDGDDDADQQTKLDALENAGYPVIRITLSDRRDLAREMYRWEVATAAAGAVLGIHPFNQPNVEAAKKLAKQAMQSASGNGQADIDEIDGADADALARALGALFTEADSDEYFSIQAYLAPTDATDEALQQLVKALRDRLGLATTLGYGPRFLHSTGQLHKGGPNTILALQLVDTPGAAVPVPETDFTFRALIRAQAIGDYQALREQDRTVLRIQLGPDVQAGLRRLLDAVDATLKATA